MKISLKALNIKVHQTLIIANIAVLLVYKTSNSSVLGDKTTSKEF